MEGQTNKNPSIIVKDLISSEHYRFKSGLKPLLDGISFQINEGDKIGISAFTKDELVCLIEIIGNMRSYYKGFVKLSTLGTKAKKRSIVEQIFYLDSPDMLYQDMNLLEHLMYVKHILYESDDAAFEDGIMQKETLDFIKRIQADDVVSTKIKNMRESTKLIVSMMIALMTSSEKVIINATNYSFSYKEADLIKKLFECYPDKTVVLATFDTKLIRLVDDRIIYISEGKISLDSYVEEVFKNFEDVTCSLASSDNKKLVEIVRFISGKRELTYYLDGESIYIKKVEPKDFVNPLFFSECAKQGVNLERICFNKGRIQSAFEQMEGVKIK